MNYNISFKSDCAARNWIFLFIYSIRGIFIENKIHIAFYETICFRGVKV